MITAPLAITELKLYQALAAKTGEMLEAANAQEFSSVVKLSAEQGEILDALQALSPSVLSPAAKDHKMRLLAEILAQEKLLECAVNQWHRQVSGQMRINRVRISLTDAYSP
ncbi:flagellar protein FliT [Candidatus Methylospira mobilis]|nr:flagellar protein FliT [Candidatus Methylospira mobilis]